DSHWYHHLFRRIRCVRGSVRIAVECRPAFDYGRKHHHVQLDAQGANFRSDNLSLSLFSAVKLQRDANAGVTAEFVLEEGKSQVFVLRNDGLDGDSPAPPSVAEAEDIFQRTVKFWQTWPSSCPYRGRWRERVERSALVLKLLTFEPTGAIIAAPTTSLPEVIGGTRNWDYRYTWLRDAAFTVYAFLRLGFTDEAAGFVSWIQNYASKHPRPVEKIPALFSIYGDRELPEYELKHWEGYKKSGPVRIGNAAYKQFQSDVYGELLDALY